MKKLFLKSILLTLVLLVSTKVSNAQSWVWAQQSTGGALNEGLSISTDRNNNSYITGSFDTTIICFGTYTLNNSNTGPSGGTNIFLAKYDSNGNVLWAKSVGGYCWANSVCNDSAGNVIITGVAYPPPMSFGTYTVSGGSVFIAKYDTNGNILWARRSAGPGGNNSGYSVSSDVFGNIFATGEFNTDSIIFGTCAAKAGSPTTQKLFIVKYDPNGNALWVKCAAGIAGASGLSGKSVSTDTIGNSYVTGSMHGFGAAFDTISVFITGGIDGFLTKYNPNGKIQWVKVFGGTGADYGTSVSTDAAGNSYFTGAFGSPSITVGTSTITQPGNRNVFVAKYDSSGNPLWAKSVGGSYFDEGYSICRYSNGFYVSGRTISPTFIAGTYTLIPSNAFDAMFIVNYDLNGNINCASVLACGGDDQHGVSVDQLGNAYICSDFYYTPFIVGSTPLFKTGLEDIFIAKFNCQPPVSQCAISNFSVDFNPSVTQGCNPLTVNFSNATVLGTSTGTVYTNWDYSNGAYNSYTNSAVAGSPNGNTTFTLTGTYPVNLSVLLVSPTNTCSSSVTKTITVTCVGIKESELQNNQIKIFPNPNSGAFKLQFDNKIIEGEIILYNSIGQQVHRQKITQSINEITTTGLVKGLYHYTILQKNQLINSGKIAIE